MEKFNQTRWLLLSLPKSGTHLLAQVLSLYPHFAFSGIHLGQDVTGYYIWRRVGVPLVVFNAMSKYFGGDELRIGTDLPNYASRRSVLKVLSRVRAGSFATAHLPYSGCALEILKTLDYKLFIMLRDPRDVAVSFSYHVVRQKLHPCHRSFMRLSHHDRLLAAINGIEADGLKLEPLFIRFTSILQWINKLDCLTVRFEDLVGDKGGGTRQAQSAQALRIGEFLGFEPGEFDASYIIEHAFSSDSPTFRKGQIGSWKDEFGPEHLSAAKATLGQLLIDLGYEEDLSW